MAIPKEHIAAGYANSNGYFKDPGTGDWITGLELRSVKAEILDDGHLVWPEIVASTGESIRIVYKCWTKEEKDLYKQYREIGKTKQHEPKVKRSSNDEQLVKPVQTVMVDPEDETKTIVITHSQEGCSTPSIKTTEVIRNATRCLGTWFFDGCIYDLLAKDDFSYTPIPRVLIPDEDKIRLHIA